MVEENKMSELKKMTEGELKPHLEALNLKLVNHEIWPIDIRVCGKFTLMSLGIELVPEMPKPQEGDVWAYELQIVEFWNIAKIHLDQACMYHIDDYGNMSTMHEAVEDMFIDNGWFLYERDGKRCPEIAEFRK